MHQDKLRKKIQSKPIYNAFSDQYSATEIEKIIDEENSSEVGVKIGYATALFNEYYRSYLCVIKDCIEKTNVDRIRIGKDFFKMANRDTYLAEKHITEMGRQQKIISVADIGSFTSNKLSISGNNMNLIQSIEGQVDICNTAFNILKHYEPKTNEKKAAQYENIIVHMFRGSNLLSVVKESYNELIWGNCYIEENEKSIIIRYRDKKLPIIKKIGEDRMMANEFHNIIAWTGLEKMGIQYKEACISKNTKYVLDTIGKKDRCMTYSLKEGEYSLDSNMVYTSAISQISIYYPDFADIKFECLNGLNLIDLIAIFSKLSSLLDAFYSGLFKDSIDDKEIDNFNFKIKKRDLTTYLKDVTTYTKKQIQSAIELFVCSFDDKSIDLWKTPLFEADNYIYFLRAAITAPNIFVNMDYWLERIGYDLKKRGLSFEKYIKYDLEKVFQNQDYIHYIANQSKFFNNRNEYQEIDLFVNLKDIVIVAEVKCIKYPMNATSYHNCLKIVEKAVSQVNTKMNFIRDNSNELIDYTRDIKDKPIIGVVILNLTLFTGITMTDIPIMDYNLFKSYFSTGQLQEFYSTGVGLVSPVSNNKYYENESEMCSNLEVFLKHPLSVEKKLKQYSLISEIVTLKNAKIPIYQEFAVKNE